MKKNTAVYGGQAVVEGVMFGGLSYTVTAIRRKDDTIEYFEIPRKENKWVRKLKKVPFLRGLVVLVEASINGTKHLNFAAERYELDHGEGEAAEVVKTDSRWAFILGATLVGILSLVIGKLIFTGVPALLAGFLDPFIYSTPQGTVSERIVSNLIEGVIKLALLLAYLHAISRIPIIKRLFQYHGAEHKVINAYERNLELTVANVQAQSTLHYRCGSSFIIFTVLAGVMIYSILNAFYPYESLWERVYERLLLIPVVIGVSYEFLQFTNQFREHPVLKYLGYPGLWLQKLTTKEPTDDQVEVAIASFKRMQELDAANSRVM